MTTIKLTVPKDLPEEGLTALAFEAWQNQTISFLEQEVVNYNFMSGNYSTWTAKNTVPDGFRIRNLHDDDAEKLRIEAANIGGANAAARNAELNQLKLKRNAQLTKCLQLVANMCQHSEQSDIMNCSTSFNWIWNYLKRHYNIEAPTSYLWLPSTQNPSRILWCSINSSVLALSTT